MRSHWCISRKFFYIPTHHMTCLAIFTNQRRVKIIDWMRNSRRCAFICSI
ncbi:hypothetical protein H206_05632 [Candidatus Electrothrix aarhusensis]|uniref:Uncharacterized protein n=1 Tax=Candidatus Electrothrix aarhusensis TaxID=1859131 RepID=A0A3S3SQH4_9BACT|nr:hypothetical protein H206_05632 [Candidatus Electrothrix aarhusensis]